MHRFQPIHDHIRDTATDLLESTVRTLLHRLGIKRHIAVLAELKSQGIVDEHTAAILAHYLETQLGPQQ